MPQTSPISRLHPRAGLFNKKGRDMSKSGFREPMTLCRALRLAVLLCEHQEAEAARAGARELVYEYKQARIVLQRECEALQVNPPDYQGVFSGVS